MKPGKSDSQTPQISSDSNTIFFYPSKKLTIEEFSNLVYGSSTIILKPSVQKVLSEAREFVDHIVQSNKIVYGITTGFADMRNNKVNNTDSDELQENLIQSHDTILGKPLPYDVILGVLVLRAHHVCRGHSGFSYENLRVIVECINKRIVPVVEDHGGLGTSDIVFLSRVFRFLQGNHVKVYYKGEVKWCDEVFEKEGIKPAKLRAMEGLGLLDGNQFTCSMMLVGFLKQIHNFENQLAGVSIFLNTIDTVRNQYSKSIHKLKDQNGQNEIAKILREFTKDSPFIDQGENTQNDYTIRAFPQLMGYHYEMINRFKDFLQKEMNSVTDNPVLFRDEQILDIDKKDIIDFKGGKWCVIPSGNWMQEYSSTMCDDARRCNARVCTVLEKHHSYLLNPARHKLKYLPAYLIFDSKNSGLKSGFLPISYPISSLTHKINYLSKPVITTANIPIGNESEEVHPYSSTSAEYFINQQELIEDFNIVYFTVILQAYSMMKINRKDEIKKESYENLICEKVFQAAQKYYQFPMKEDAPFGKPYSKIRELLKSNELREIIGYPLKLDLNEKNE